MDNKKVNENIIEGRNAVLEAFRSGKPVDNYMCWMAARMVRSARS